MFKPRFVFRLFIAFILRFKSLLVIGLILGLGLFFLLRFGGGILQKGDTEIIGVTGRYSVDTLPLDVLKLAGDGLTKLNEEGLPEPDLAEAWQSADSGKTWQFTLRDATWQDGQKVTSSSIRYDFLNVTVERPNEKTIVFRLQDAYAPFPSAVSRPTFKSGLLGTGARKVTDISLSGNFVQSITFVNNKKGKKIIKFYPLEERTKLAFRLGDVDILTDLTDAKPFDTYNTALVTPEVNFNRYVAVFFNTDDKALGEKSLRQALAYAIDKKGFGEARAISPLAPTSWAFNPQVKTYDLDQLRAKELINELPSEIKNDLSINLATTPTLLSVAETIAKQWDSVGVKTNVQVTSSLPSEFSAFLAIVDIPIDPDQYTLWHSTQVATNISKYKNPRIDKLLEDGRVTLDFEQRRALYLDFQRFLVEDSPAIFLYHPTSYTVKRG